MRPNENRSHLGAPFYHTVYTVVKDFFRINKLLLCEKSIVHCDLYML